MSVTERIKTLEEVGFSYIGKGKYSYVLADGATCLKLISTEDAPQIYYYTNPIFAKVCGEYYPNYLNSNTVNSGYIEFYGKVYQKPPERYKGVSWKYFVRCVRDYVYKGAYSYLLDDNLCIALDFLSKTAKTHNYMLDISSNNLLFDGSQLIINDPLAPKKDNVNYVY
jgi:hypothetical protein